jgi:hypothetical protein
VCVAVAFGGRVPAAAICRGWALLQQEKTPQESDEQYNRRLSAEAMPLLLDTALSARPPPSNQEDIVLQALLKRCRLMAEPPTPQRSRPARRQRRRARDVDAVAEQVRSDEDELDAAHSSTEWLEGSSMPTLREADGSRTTDAAAEEGGEEGAGQATLLRESLAEARELRCARVSENLLNMIPGWSAFPVIERQRYRFRFKRMAILCLRMQGQSCRAGCAALNRQGSAAQVATERGVGAQEPRSEASCCATVRATQLRETRTTPGRTVHLRQRSWRAGELDAASAPR